MTWVIICFMAMVIVSLWHVAGDNQAKYEKEWKEHLETHRENGRLMMEIDRLRVKHNDWD